MDWLRALVTLLGLAWLPLDREHRQECLCHRICWADC
jgi:hypothetical protein